MACAYITDLANNIWIDIGQPTSMPVSYIQSKLTSNAFLGNLDTLTTNCHQIVSGDISPPLDINEQGICALMYKTDFYNTQINNILGGSAIPFITIQDGDSRITQVSVVDMARLYRDQYKELRMELNNMVYNYRQANGLAQSCDFYSIDNSWRGTVSYNTPYITGPY